MPTAAGGRARLRRRYLLNEPGEVGVCADGLAVRTHPARQLLRMQKKVRKVTFSSPTTKPRSKIVPTNTPAIAPPACSNPSVRLTSPGVNLVVRGKVPVRGTANISNFQFYKMEVGAGPNPKQWSVVGQLHHSPVVGGVLATFSRGCMLIEFVIGYTSEKKGVRYD